MASAGPARVRSALTYLALVALSTAHAQTTSRLFGKSGESFDPRGRLPDVSFAGYAQGDRPIPNVAVVANVKSFGAKGDNRTDDTTAFQRAINATRGGALSIPAGTYVLSDVLRVQTGNLVLRGDGQDKTVLRFTKSLETLRGKNRNWSWSGGLLWVEPTGKTTPRAQITMDALRGDTTLTVDTTAGLAPGNLIELILLDRTPSLGRHLHAGFKNRGTCSWQRTTHLSWPVRIASVRPGLVTLTQPLRTDVRTAWTPRLLQAPYVREFGIEKLRIRFDSTSYAGHLKEHGFNAIYFANGVVDSWIRDVTITNTDSAILLRTRIKNCEVRKVRFTGRAGHYGVQLARCADVLVTEFRVDCDRVHALSVQHHANGCVFSQGSGRLELEMDHHRDGPFENVFTNLRSRARPTTGGSSCAGPYTAARETFWNMPNNIVVPGWLDVESNVIGRFAGAEQTTRRRWYERVPGLVPADLHVAQLALRRRAKPTRFSPIAALGDRRSWSERDPARWLVVPDGPEQRYALTVAAFPAPTGALLGEHTVFQGRRFSDVALSALARSLANLSTNADADFALVIGFQDDRNYYAASFGTNQQTAGIYRVRAGARTLLARASTATLADNRFHRVFFVRNGSQLLMGRDGAVVATARDAAFANGLVGLGSRDDAAAFDNVEATVPLVATPASLSVAAASKQTMTLAAGSDHAGQWYVIAGSAKAARSGLALGAWTLPLEFDAYFGLLIGNPNAWIVPSIGRLDASGRARATFTLPSGQTALVGTTLRHAYVVLGSAAFDFASNAAPLRLIK